MDYIKLEGKVPKTVPDQPAVWHLRQKGWTTKREANASLLLFVSLLHLAFS